MRAIPEGIAAPAIPEEGRYTYNVLLQAQSPFLALVLPHFLSLVLFLLLLLSYRDPGTG